MCIGIIGRPHDDLLKSLQSIGEVYVISSQAEYDKLKDRCEAVVVCNSINAEGIQLDLPRRHALIVLDIRRHPRYTAADYFRLTPDRVYARWILRSPIHWRWYFGDMLPLLEDWRDIDLTKKQPTAYASPTEVDTLGHIGKHFDVVDIGASVPDSSFYSPVLESPKGSTLLCVDPMEHYLAAIPDLERTYKEVKAIAPRGIKSIEVFDVPSDVVDTYKLPNWVKGCTSTGKPHALAMAELQKVGKEDLMRKSVVSCTTIEALFDKYDIGTVDYFKVDTEGVEGEILRQLMEICAAQPYRFPAKIRYETAHITPQECIEISAMLRYYGYILQDAGIDTVATLAAPTLCKYREPAHEAEIPKVIHTVWLGEEMPKEYSDYMEQWRVLNPEYEVKVWSEEDIPSLGIQHLVDQALTYAGKADVMRFHILRDHGGYYIDTDMKPLRPLREIDTTTGLIVCRQNNLDSMVGVSFLAAPPQHPALREMCKRLAPGIPEGNPVKHTGPLAWGSIINDPRWSRSELPVHVMYPLPYTAPRTTEVSKEVYPGSIACHMWGASWVSTYES